MDNHVWLIWLEKIEKMVIDVQNVVITNIAMGTRLIAVNAQGVVTISLPTSGALFHKVKFSILRAFYIVYIYRFNRNFMTKAVFENLLQRMIIHPP